ncbi:MAG: diguanylate cyclase, partial [Candidatus Nanopelagicales bacterium]|nr:diguanylate cyclase [Candidatus Nanopelagicales bacterium]
MDHTSPIAIAPGVWWVGATLPNDSFQCHAYFIDNGDSSVLIDPGSMLTIESTLAKVEQVASLDSIRYLVCHHPDPDIAASLAYLSARLARPDVQVVTEWRAKALLKHYGHRFGYLLVEEHDWVIELAPDRRLEFQLTPYLHFPGAMVSYDTATATLFSSDIFGGFVPDADVLESHDLDLIIESARPFHQHYMPSTELLTAGLTRIQHRWPHIARIAPQHGHIIPEELVAPAFSALKDLECGIFSLDSTDLDLERLLLIAEAKTRITQTLLTAASPTSLVAALNVILAATHEASECALFVDIPEQGWTMWGLGVDGPLLHEPTIAWPSIVIPGVPAAQLAIRTPDEVRPNADLMSMLAAMASTIRPAIDGYLAEVVQERRSAVLSAAAFTDPLTGLGNRRALEQQEPAGDYSVISLDLDHFKRINDTHGHAAGDEALRRVAQALRSSVRDGDALYRVGGEEFLVCSPGAGPDQALAIAERIRAAVRDLDFTGVTPDGHMTVS